MATFKISDESLWRRLEASPYKAFVQKLVSSMETEGYSQSSARSVIYISGRFVEWLEEPGPGSSALDYSAFDRFLKVPTLSHLFGHGERKALRRLRAIMVDAGIIGPAPATTDPIDVTFDRFANHLLHHGYQPKSIIAFGSFCKPFLREVWTCSEGIAHLRAPDILSYVERRAARYSRSSASLMCCCLRGFLRYARAEGLVEADLALAVPKVRNVKQAGLPCYMSTEQLEAVLAGCNRATVAGKRDYAILLLLARLGLRAVEVARLTLDAIDWREGLVRIDGKGGKVATMPLPDDVGMAIIEYIRGGRPRTRARTLFHLVEAPRSPFTSATPVILIARRALHRAGVTGLGRKSHSFRHTLATNLIRAGASLNEIAQVLRHQDADTARIYAKVDVESLRTLSLPWPGGAL